MPARKRSRAHGPVVAGLLCALVAGTVFAAPPAKIRLPGLTTVSDAAWNDTAVRQVLHTFAFGSHATDAQLAAWARLPPQTAIVEMLSFGQHNLLLSPPVPTLATEHLEQRSNTLRSLGNFFSSDKPGNRIPVDQRTNYTRGDWRGAFLTWSMAARARR